MRIRFRFRQNGTCKVLLRNTVRQSICAQAQRQAAALRIIRTRNDVGDVGGKMIIMLLAPGMRAVSSCRCLCVCVCICARFVLVILGWMGWFTADRATAAAASAYSQKKRTRPECTRVNTGECVCLCLCPRVVWWGGEGRMGVFPIPARLLSLCRLRSPLIQSYTRRECLAPPPPPLLFTREFHGARWRAQRFLFEIRPPVRASSFNTLSSSAIVADACVRRVA